MEWLRLYSNIINDPKIMQMPERYRWRYIALLCLFRIKSDSFPTESEIIFSMRIKKQEWELTKKEFEKRGLIVEDTINGWTTRQYKSDDSYARVKRFRNVSETPELKDVTVTVTPPDTDTDTDTETEQKKKRITPQAAILPTYFDNDPFKKTFEDFKDMRKSIKSKMTSNAENLIIKKLSDLSNNDSDTAIKIMEQSIMNSYKGVFELKDKVVKYGLD